MMNSIGIGHNQGPPMGGLSTLPVAEKAIGGAITKSVKAGLKSLSSMFESVGSGLKKTDLKKDERKEAASAIQNEIDKVSKANNRKFKPKILRLEIDRQSKNNRSKIVVAAVDEENGKVAAILDGTFFTKKDIKKEIKNSKGDARPNKNYGKMINYLNVGGFFPIQSGHNISTRNILKNLNVPIYDKDEGIISPEQLEIINKRQSEGAMGHRKDKLEMGTKGVYGFTKSLQAGLPITDAHAGRVSGAKGAGGQLNIRGAAIKDTAAPMESLPDIDVSYDLLEQMGDTGLASLTVPQLEKITNRINPNIGSPEMVAYQKNMRDTKQEIDKNIVEQLRGASLPSNVKRVQALEKRRSAFETGGAAANRKDPYMKRVTELEASPVDSQGLKINRARTIGEVYPKENLIEKLQYGLLSRLSGGTSGKKGLMSLIKRGEDEMIVGRRSPTDQEQVMVTADGERLVPKSTLLDPRVRKERVGINRNIVESENELGSLSPEEQRRRVQIFEDRQVADQDYRDRRGAVLDDDSLGDNPEPPENLQGLQRLMGVGEDLDDEGQDAFDRVLDNVDEDDIVRSRRQIYEDSAAASQALGNLRTMDAVIESFESGIITEDEVFNYIRLFRQAGILEEEEAIEEQVNFRDMLNDLSQEF